MACRLYRTDKNRLVHQEAFAQMAKRLRTEMSSSTSAQ